MLIGPRNAPGFNYAILGTVLYLESSNSDIHAILLASR
jgi:hypothetical protein